MIISCLWKKHRKCISSFVLSIFLFLTFHLPLNANVSSPITGSIRLSVCGDGIVEGNEQCEPEYEEIFQCSDIGSYTGETTCDISCEFDMFNCTPVIPPVEEPEEPTDPGAGGGDETVVPPTNVVPPSTIEVIIEDITTYIKHLLIPEVYRQFDLNKDGVLTAEEFNLAIRTWVEGWRYFNINFPVVSGKDSCDLNGDRICNVVDLSILLYYSE
jgi:hypothetical protein